MSSSKRAATPFKKSHTLDFALEVVSTDSRGDVSVQCLFCLYEGRQVVEVGVAGRKRKQRNDIQYFTKSFAPFKYRSHHLGQHAASWTEYQMLSNPTDAARKQLIKKKNEKKNAIKLFCKEEEVSVYTTTIKDVVRFDLAMDFVSIGLSFRQTTEAMQKAKTRTKTTKLSGLNDSIAGQYTRVLVAVALQQIVVILDHESVWAMSLAGDGSTHRGQSFFDLRVRACYRGELMNLHLAAIPMFDRHSAVHIFNLIVKFMDALYNKWRAKLIGVSTEVRTP
ncbi:unnamed protein product [Sphagnum troendelagicum]|uniref:Uncharacterized protein n=1 Tax=Sphagnum troendelagicum TaxID=128251 RepID=A0ABP0V0D2_9BRYO